MFLHANTGGTPLEIIGEALGEAFFDLLGMLPLLFLSYLLMEWLEARAGEKTERAIARAKGWGPVIGGLLGVIPQCGISGAVAGFFSARVVTLGTFISVILTTSDEMIPIMISRGEFKKLPGVLLFKLAAGIISGLVIDFILRIKKRGELDDSDIHSVCEAEGCKCEHGILRSALMHTLKVSLMIFAVSALLGVVFGCLGEDVLDGLPTNIPVAGEVIAGLVGLIPSCAVSVLLTDLYLDGAISVGVMMSGLLVNGGIGLLVLFRLNKKRMRENIKTVALIFSLGVLWGVLARFIWLI